MKRVGTPPAGKKPSPKARHGAKIHPVNAIPPKTANIKAGRSRYTLAAQFLCLCLAIFTARNLFGAKPDPCHSPLRCHRVAEILRSRNPAQIEKLYAGGCQDAPERIARALQLYTLHQPDSEQLILQAIPQSYKEYFATLEISSSELYGPKYPPLGATDYYAQMSAKYNIPAGCVDENQADMDELGRLVDFWWKILIPIVARHPEYMPQTFGLYEFFGDDNPPVGEEEGFPDLVRELYRLSPKAFCEEVKQSKWGHWALVDALTTFDDFGAPPSKIEATMRHRKCGVFGIRKPPKQKPARTL
jgi:hypothetical protein